MTVTSDEYLEIDGVPLHTHAWRIVDLAPLQQGAARRGADRKVPGAPGVRAYPRRANVTVHALEMFVFGHLDEDGAPHADPREGLEENVAYLRANVTDPTNVGDGTRTAVLHLPSGATRQAPVHVEGFELAALGPVAFAAVLTLSIPEGALS